MTKKTIEKKVTSTFEKIRKIDKNGNEYWNSRELSKVLEYADYRIFLSVIEKAKEACKNSNYQVSDHFVDFTEMIELAKSAQRQVNSVKLSRYACYLIVQNGDPAKDVIALGQSYFAIQTRLQEITKMEEYNKLISEDEKRLFLRAELKRHNMQLADAAHHSGVINAIDLLYFKIMAM